METFIHQENMVLFKKGLAESRADTERKVPVN
jgi:hypothetical protein